ncbi:hypothetical protein X768_21640 [Mesorhizobium sp. LSJC265A00]|nr:hypothetical protein X768_21640 [Mesorhizobium sp. LSJC265A00]ESY06850.1 hypothetical protein X753_14390 [Mesorhizobium sp. LNJC399B00]
MPIMMTTICDLPRAAIERQTLDEIEHQDDHQESDQNADKMKPCPSLAMSEKSTRRQTLWPLIGSCRCEAIGAA